MCVCVCVSGWRWQKTRLAGAVASRPLQMPVSLQHNEDKSTPHHVRVFLWAPTEIGNKICWATNTSFHRFSLQLWGEEARKRLAGSKWRCPTGSFGADTESNGCDDVLGQAGPSLTVMPSWAPSGEKRPRQQEAYLQTPFFRCHQI